MQVYYRLKSRKFIYLRDLYPGLSHVEGWESKAAYNSTMFKCFGDIKVGWASKEVSKRGEDLLCAIQCVFTQE